MSGRTQILAFYRLELAGRPGRFYELRCWMEGGNGWTWADVAAGIVAPLSMLTYAIADQVALSFLVGYGLPLVKLGQLLAIMALAWALIYCVTAATLHVRRSVVRSFSWTGLGVSAALTASLLCVAFWIDWLAVTLVVKSTT
jgi:hypothetical protein